MARVRPRRPWLLLAVLLASLVVGCGGAPTTAPTSPPATPATGLPVPAAVIDTQRGVAYGDDPAQVLDLAVPPASAPSPTGDPRARPTIVFVHGGGWTEGDRGVYAGVATRLAREGWVTASVGYRLAPGATHPQPADDVRAALAFVVEDAGLPVDPDRVVLAGDSAGGHLAALVALSEPQVPVAAWVAWSGVYDLPQVTADVEDTGVGWLADRIAAHLGCATPATGPCRARADDASPIRQVDAGDPPGLLLHSRREIVPLQDARAVRDALQAADVRADLEVYDGSRHGLGLLAVSADRVGQFLADVLDLPA